MSGFKHELAEVFRRWLPRLLPWLPISLAWWQMIGTQLAQAAGSGS
ncbi:MAG: hypothetical protein ACXIUM_02815 [Wenzhouxiangella sp.]